MKGIQKYTKVYTFSAKPLILLGRPFWAGIQKYTRIPLTTLIQIAFFPKQKYTFFRKQPSAALTENRNPEHPSPSGEQNRTLPPSKTLYRIYILYWGQRQGIVPGRRDRSPPVRARLRAGSHPCFHGRSNAIIKRDLKAFRVSKGSDPFDVRLPANKVLQESIAHLLRRPVDRLTNHARRYCPSFSYPA